MPTRNYKSLNNREKATASEVRRALDDFNAACPIGSRVSFRLDGSERSGFVMAPGRLINGRGLVQIAGLVKPVPTVGMQPFGRFSEDADDDSA